MLHGIRWWSERSSERSIHLFSLPQELQDIIFALAYLPAEGAVYDYLSRHAWQELEEDKEASAGPGSDYMLRPYPGPTVDNFLVSKKFFQAAAQAWACDRDFSYRAQDWDFERQRGVFESLGRLPGRGIVPAFARIEEALRDAFDADDFRKLVTRDKAKGMRLRRLELVFDDWLDQGKTAEQKRLLLSNVKAFEHFLRPLVMENVQGARQVERVGSVCKACQLWRDRHQAENQLYATSKVCIGAPWAQFMSKALSYLEYSVILSAVGLLTYGLCLLIDLLEEQSRADAGADGGCWRRVCVRVSTPCVGDATLFSDHAVRVGGE